LIAHSTFLSGSLSSRTTSDTRDSFSQSPSDSNPNQSGSLNLGVHAEDHPDDEVYESDNVWINDWISKVKATEVPDLIL
jgi:hypothetical protein